LIIPPGAAVLDNTTLAEIGALVGDQGRANMLAALLDGRALTAKELAAHAGVAPQTASGHLARLIAAGLIVMRQQGRHRYHTLASPDVASMLESMTSMASTRSREHRAPPLRVGPRDAALRAARTCYDHLAGRLAVDVADAMAARGQVEIDHDVGMVTREGKAFLRDLGIDVHAIAPSRHLFFRTCLDWSERRLHLAGPVGAALLRRTLQLRWLRRIDGSRALAVTAGGHEGFRRTFGVEATR
jgi:DNA-binding transcriptional ArsR family regulator